MEALCNLGIEYGLLGRHRKSIRLFKSAVRSNKHHIKALYNLGVSYTLIGDNEAALKIYNVIKTQDEDSSRKLHRHILENHDLDR